MKVISSIFRNQGTLSSLRGGSDCDCGMRENEEEAPFQSLPLHFERKYFLGADVSGDQRRVIRREPEPLADRSRSPASHLELSFRDQR